MILYWKHLSLFSRQTVYVGLITNYLSYTKITKSRFNNSIFSFYLEYVKKQCASAFWNGELESELRELERLDFFGLMKRNEDREKVMEEVEKIRAKGVYHHSSEDCSDACIARGEKFH